MDGGISKDNVADKWVEEEPQTRIYVTYNIEACNKMIWCDEDE